MNTDTTKTDYRLDRPPAFPDDITYCTADCAAECFRHRSHIDWEQAKHKYYGASVADFGGVCASHRKTPLQRLISFLYDDHVRADRTLKELAEDIMSILDEKENRDA